MYTIIEGLADGGVKQGIPRQMAIQFAAQTLLGAAKTVLQTGKHPAVLRDEVRPTHTYTHKISLTMHGRTFFFQFQVCSPGGTTIQGVHELEKGGVR